MTAGGKTGGMRPAGGTDWEAVETRKSERQARRASRPHSFHSRVERRLAKGKKVMPKKLEKYQLGKDTKAMFRGKLGPSAEMIAQQQGLAAQGIDATSAGKFRESSRAGLGGGLGQGLEKKVSAEAESIAKSGAEQKAQSNLAIQTEANQQAAAEATDVRDRLSYDAKQQAKTEAQAGAASAEIAAIIGSIMASMAAAGAFSSDRRLKGGIEWVGKSPTGIPLYLFHYLDDPKRTKYHGTMAQDLLEKHPEAVATMPNGYYGVDYSLIDVDFYAIGGPTNA